MWYLKDLVKTHQTNCVVWFARPHNKKAAKWQGELSIEAPVSRTPSCVPPTPDPSSPLSPFPKEQSRPREKAPVGRLRENHWRQRRLVRRGRAPAASRSHIAIVRVPWQSARSVATRSPPTCSLESCHSSALSRKFPRITRAILDIHPHQSWPCRNRRKLTSLGSLRIPICVQFMQRELL